MKNLTPTDTARTASLALGRSPYSKGAERLAADLEKPMNAMNTSPAFTTWTYSGTRFLAFKNLSGNVAVSDENGASFGAWMSVERFRALQTARDPLAAPMAGVDEKGRAYRVVVQLCDRPERVFTETPAFSNC